MPSYYEYLISSLPMLSFGMKPPLSFAKLVVACETLIPDRDIETLKAVIASVDGCGSSGNRTLAKWASFETMLRNELVKIRSLRKKTDPVKYLRQDGCPESAYAAHMAINAYRKPSILEAEKALDIERWRELDELAVGHYFDLDALIVYAQKLLILEKWDNIQMADKARLLEDSLAGAAS
jgi:hypothetical protein